MEFFAISNNIPVHILDTKKGNTTILLLHGYLETLYVFNEFIELLSAKYRVIAIDLPGHGLSGSEKEINTMEFSASIAADVLRICKVETAYVAGHSMGGAVAQHCIKYYPNLFKGLIMLNSTPLADSPEKKTDRLREIELILNSKLTNLASLSIPKMYASSNLRRLDEKIEETIEITETHDPNGIVACLRGLIEKKPTKDVISSLNDSVLFIYGDQDKYIPNELRDKLIEEFPNAKNIIIPNTGHNSFIENPQAVFDAICAFAQ